MVMITLSRAGEQEPWAVEVSINVTLPFAVSVAEGWYVVDSKVALSNVPLPEDDVQVHAVASGPDVPTSATSELLAQTVDPIPASTLGPSVIVITTISLTELQEP